MLRLACVRESQASIDMEMKMKFKWCVALLFVIVLAFAVVFSCGDDDDDDNDDDSLISDDDDGDDPQGICLDGQLIEPLPNPGMLPDAICTSCHATNGIAPFAHQGQYDTGAPATCMTAQCHACPESPTGNDDDSVTDDDDSALSNGPGGFDPDYKTSSDFFTLMEGLKAGAFNARVWIYYSSNVLPIIETDSFLVPEGTTSIQEVDDDGDDVVDFLSVMVKMDENYDPENNNWYYEVRDPDGTLRSIPAPGKIQVCIQCHEDFPQTDYFGGTALR